MKVLKIHDKYKIMPTGYGSFTYKINGAIFEGITSEQPCWMEEEPTEIIKLEKSTRTVSFGLLSPEDYIIEINRLIENTHTNDYGGLIFPDLEKEYEYKKFVSEHPPTTEPFLKETTVDFFIAEITGDTSNPYITPYRFLNTKNKKVDDSLYEYIPNPMKLARDIAPKYGFVEVEDKMSENTKGLLWSVPKHSQDTLRFIKVNGKYMDSLLPKWRSEPKFTGVSAGTLEECLKAYNQHYLLIDNLFKQAKLEYDAQGRSVDRKKVVDELQKISSLLDGVDTKAKSEIKTWQIQAKIKELREELLKT
jgi:hypothetical protein